MQVASDQVIFVYGLSSRTRRSVGADDAAENGRCWVIAIKIGFILQATRNGYDACNESLNTCLQATSSSRMAMEFR
jgi:hypothetical protein